MSVIFAFLIGVLVGAFLLTLGVAGVLRRVL